MKALIFVLLITFSFNVLAKDKCSTAAENALQNEGQLQPAVLVEINSDGNLVYNIRANLHGGDSAHEVVLTSNCKIVSKRVLWSE